MSAATQKILVNFGDQEYEFSDNKKADIINLFKVPKGEKLKRVTINRSMLNSPTWLPVLRTENLELKEFLDKGITKLKYKNKEEFELFFNPTFGAPGKFEEKLFYVLLSAVQMQKKQGVEDFRVLRFPSFYSILGLMGYDQDSCRNQRLLDQLEAALHTLATTGVHHKKFYKGKDTRGNDVYKDVFVGSMLTGIVIDNVFSGRSHTIELSINKEYYNTTLAHQFEIADLDIPALADISSAPALRMYEILNSKNYTLESRGWWSVYLDNFLESFGVEGKFQHQSDKLRFLKDAFQKCKPALKLPLEDQIKDSIHFTYWQNTAKRFRKPQDLTLCFYTSRWEPYINYNKKELEAGYFKDIELPFELPKGFG